MYVAGAFLFSGFVNILPLLPFQGIFAPKSADRDIAVLMRHREVLFGILGSYLLLAAFRKKMRMTGYVLGFTSMASYLAIAANSELLKLNEQLQRKFWIDAAAIAALAIAPFLERNRSDDDN